MNILYFFKKYDTPMYTWQKFHIFDELERHNCHVEVFNPLNFSTIEQANEELLKKIKENKYDLFMTPHNEDDLYIETLKEIKSLGIPTLLICFDNLVVPYRHKKVAKYFDLVWLTSIETQNLFVKWGAKTIFLPYAANPILCKPNHVANLNKIVFVGTPYGSRVPLINKLINSNIDIDLYYNSNQVKNSNAKDTKSNSFHSGKVYNFCNMMSFDIGRKIIIGALKNKLFFNSQINKSENISCKNSIDVNELSKIYANYSLSLSSTDARNTGVLKNPVSIINLRSFEIPMCGGLQFCRFNDELSSYFEDEKEIVFYHNDEDYIEKAKFYLNSKNESLIINLKFAARKRAEEDHTWFCRFKKAFSELGLTNLYD